MGIGGHSYLGNGFQMIEWLMGVDLFQCHFVSLEGTLKGDIYTPEV